jgi:hypothetical protein
MVLGIVSATTGVIGLLGGANVSLVSGMVCHDAQDEVEEVALHIARTKPG